MLELYTQSAQLESKQRSEFKPKNGLQFINTSVCRYTDITHGISAFKEHGYQSKEGAILDNLSQR